MDGEEFKIRGKEMVDYIVQYLDLIEERRVTPGILNTLDDDQTFG